MFGLLTVNTTLYVGPLANIAGGVDVSTVGSATDDDVIAMVAGGVREEIQRGFILHRFSQYLGGGLIGLIVHSTVFGLGHVDQGWDAAIAVATLGAIWGTIYLIRRSIVAPMVSHAGFNLAQVIKYLVLR